MRTRTTDSNDNSRRDTSAHTYNETTMKHPYGKVCMPVKSFCTVKSLYNVRTRVTFNEYIITLYKCVKNRSFHCKINTYIDIYVYTRMKA